MTDLIERMRLLKQDHEPDGWPAVRMRDITALLDSLEAAREDADAVKRVLAVVEEFEGCTGAGYRYMAANIRSAIDQARGKGVAE